MIFLGKNKFNAKFRYVKFVFIYIIIIICIQRKEKNKRKLMNEVKEKNVGYYHLVFLHCLTHTHTQTKQIYARIRVVIVLYNTF